MRFLFAISGSSKWASIDWIVYINFELFVVEIVSRLKASKHLSWPSCCLFVHNKHLISVIAQFIRFCISLTKSGSKVSWATITMEFVHAILYFFFFSFSFAMRFENIVIEKQQNCDFTVFGQLVCYKIILKNSLNQISAFADLNCSNDR